MVIGPAVFRRAQNFVPLATGFTSGWVPAASRNRLPPVAVTVAGAVVSTVYGPIWVPTGPSASGGVTVRLGGGGLTSGPRLMTFATMAATALRRAWFEFRTYLSLKNQIASWTAAALSFALARDAGSLVFG